MAPLYIRQNHSLVPAPPRPPKGPSTPPVEVTTSIDPKVFGELLAGTVGIFILAVFVWKTGKFIRSFSRHRVVREGNAATARYARTWYGWIPLETHERNKAFFRNILTRLRRWTMWKSTRTDYRWVWWDPGQEAMKARHRDQRPLRWLPECVKSYDVTPADAIWNPRPLAECYGALLDSPESETPPSPESSRRSHDTTVNPLSPRYSNQYSRTQGRVPSASQEPYKHDPQASDVHDSDDQSEDIQWADARTAKNSSTMSQDSPSLSHLRLVSSLAQERALCPFPNLDGSSSPRGNSSIQRPRPIYFPTVHETTGLPPHVGIHMPHRRPAQSRKYRVWSAQMQVKRKRLNMTNFRDSSGPPGTPATGMFGSLFSESNASEIRLSRQTITIREVKAQPEMSFFRADPDSLVKQGNQHAECNTAEHNTAPSRYRATSKKALVRDHTWHTLRTPKTSWARGSIHASRSLRGNVGLGYRSFQDSTTQASGVIARPFDGLSDWEVRLMDQLDRKLVWMFNETTPGQKPYHFARLANHWLNRETWLVIDPVSRVSIDKRREMGDPRFNAPYPERDFSPRPKHPVLMRRRAQAPRIDSWRAAVNRQRRMFGVQEAIRTVTLYEDSVEEPPDGKIDTACWILPKPPQGFEMSTKQKNAWYEGGYGWQEKLDDWQQVRRGYRLHQMLHEGRANRHRVKEVATHVNRCCRAVSAKLMPREVDQTSRPSVPAF